MNDGNEKVTLAFSEPNQVTNAQLEHLHGFNKLFELVTVNGSAGQVREWLNQPLTCKHGHVRVRHIQHALQLAVILNRCDVVCELLAAHARLEASFGPKGVRGLKLGFLLMLAAEHGNKREFKCDEKDCVHDCNITRQLLHAGAPVDFAVENNKTPLQVAAKHDCVQAAQALLDAGASVNASVQHRGTYGQCAEDYPIGLARSIAMTNLLLRRR